MRASLGEVVLWYINTTDGGNIHNVVAVLICRSKVLDIDFCVLSGVGCIEYEMGIALARTKIRIRERFRWFGCTNTAHVVSFGTELLLLMILIELICGTSLNSSSNGRVFEWISSKTAAVGDGISSICSITHIQVCGVSILGIQVVNIVEDTITLAAVNIVSRVSSWVWIVPHTFCSVRVGNTTRQVFTLLFMLLLMI